MLVLKCPTWRRGSLRRVCLALLAATALASGSRPGPAAASSVRPASAEVVATPPVELRVPPDGRLNGDGFAAQVSGYRFVHQFGAGRKARRARAGEGAPPVRPDVHQHFGNGPPPSRRAGRNVARRAGLQPHDPPVLPRFRAPVGDRRRPTALGVRVRPGVLCSPRADGKGYSRAVLYEGTTGWEQTEHLSGLAVLSGPGPRRAVHATSQQPLLISAALTYFLPGSNATPSGASRAWLVLKGWAFGFFPSPEPGAPGFSYARPMTGRDVTLVLPGGTAVAAKRASGQTGGLFDGTYYWQVPATMTQATVKMSLPPLTPSGPGSTRCHRGLPGVSDRRPVAGGLPRSGAGLLTDQPVARLLRHECRPRHNEGARAGPGRPARGGRRGKRPQPAHGVVAPRGGCAGRRSGGGSCGAGAPWRPHAPPAGAHAAVPTGARGVPPVPQPQLTRPRCRRGANGRLGE